MGTMSSRCYRWRKVRIWQRILSDLQAEANQRGEIDWDIHFMDATVARAQQHVADVRRDGATPEEVQVRGASGRSQGRFSTELHRRAGATGGRSPWYLTGGEQTRRSLWRRCWIRARTSVRDAAARARLRRRHIRPVIPTRKDQPCQRNFSHAACRLRNKIERLINRLKQARRIATRYDKRGNNYLAMIHIGMILLWMRPFADTA